MDQKDILKRIYKEAADPTMEPRKSEVRTKPMGTPARRGTEGHKEVDGDRDRRAPDFVSTARKNKLKQIYGRPTVFSK